MAFDTYLKDIRTERNVNQTQMAEILDISRTAIKLIENGSTKYPSKKVLHNLSVYLNESELDVMAKILFTDKSLDDKSSDEYFVCSYLTHMYLEGWNINDHPYIYPIWQGKSIEFDGRITKKRQPKNKMIVTTFKRECYRIKTILNKEDAIAFIGDLASKVMIVLDEFRGINLVFDNRSDEGKKCFLIFNDLKLNSFPCQFEVILFDVVDDQIISRNKL